MGNFLTLVVSFRVTEKQEEGHKVHSEINWSRKINKISSGRIIMSGSCAKARTSAPEDQCGEGKGSDSFFCGALMPLVVRLDRTPFGHITPTNVQQLMLEEVLWHSTWRPANLSPLVNVNLLVNGMTSFKVENFHLRFSVNFPLAPDFAMLQNMPVAVKAVPHRFKKYKRKNRKTLLFLFLI